ILALVTLAGIVLLPRAYKHWTRTMDTVPDAQDYDITLEKLSAAKVFTLTFSTGSMAITENRTYRLTQSGNVDYFGWASTASPPYCQRVHASFPIDEDTLADLYQLLIETRFFSLAKHYRARPDVMDGKGLSIEVRCDEIRKQVSCSNAFPEEVIQLESFLD